MMLRPLVIYFVALTSSGLALAQDEQDALDPLALTVAAWVSEATGRPMPAVMPVIRFATPRDMPGYMGAASSPGASVGSEVIAFYDPSVRSIFLPAGWTGSTPAELSVLVHEMVHHAQTSAESRFACPAEREREAYDVQKRWLSLFGTDLAQEFGMDPMFLLVTTTCGMP